MRVSISGSTVWVTVDKSDKLSVNGFDSVINQLDFHDDETSVTFNGPHDVLIGFARAILAAAGLKEVAPCQGGRAMLKHLIAILRGRRYRPEVVIFTRGWPCPIGVDYGL